MVERFNRRIAQAIASAPKSTRNAGKNTFTSQKDRTEYLTSFVNAYNRTRLRCLSYKAPLEIIANQTEHYTKAGGYLAVLRLWGVGPLLSQG